MKREGGGGRVEWTQTSRLNGTVPTLIVDGSLDFGFGCSRVREGDRDGSGRSKENPRLKGVYIVLNDGFIFDICTFNFGCDCEWSSSWKHFRPFDIFFEAHDSCFPLHLIEVLKFIYFWKLPPD